MPYFPLNEQAKTTLQNIRRNVYDSTLPQQNQETQKSTYTHIVEPYSSDIEALTPMTEKKTTENNTRVSLNRLKIIFKKIIFKNIKMGIVFFC